VPELCDVFERLCRAGLEAALVRVPHGDRADWLRSIVWILAGLRVRAITMIEPVPFSALSASTTTPPVAPSEERPSPARWPWWLSPLAWIFVVAIELYRRLVPDRWKRRCIYAPTCSAFGLAAVKKYGGVRGARATWRRIHRCNGALYQGGEDPV
jgi:putative membrane protein insertion efficiency factor